MVKIRLTRLGKHKKPFFRIIAIDQRKRRDGAYLELFGTYDPISKKVTINEKTILEFLNKGAQPSQTVLNILKKHGIWVKFKSTKIKMKSHKRSMSAKRKLSKVKQPNTNKEEKNK